MSLEKFAATIICMEHAEYIQEVVPETQLVSGPSVENQEVKEVGLGQQVQTLSPSRGATEAPIDPNPKNWIDHASCYGSELAIFFPDNGATLARAQQICAGCKVEVACLEFALLKRIEHGVWGGVSERERRRMLKRQREE